MYNYCRLQFHKTEIANNISLGYTNIDVENQWCQKKNDLFS